MWLRGKQSQIYSVNNTECLKCARYILSVDHTEINQKSLRAYILANYFITVLLLVFGYKERIKIIRQSVALKKKNVGFILEDQPLPIFFMKRKILIQTSAFRLADL